MLYTALCTLWDVAVKNLGRFVPGYIDPSTMHHVVTFLGPILAFFTAAASVTVSFFLFNRRRLLAWSKKASRLKLFVLWSALVIVLTTIIVVAYKFVL